LFKFSKKIIYAIEAVIDIAYHTGKDPIQNIDVARRQGIPKRYLEQTLQSLVRSNILVGSRGPKGGYRLAKEKRKIKISDIILSVQNSTVSDQKNKSPKSEISEKIIYPMLSEITNNSLKKLESISIEDICMKARKLNIPSNIKNKIDFVI
tara:strand:- start:2189 stop:2641 length:453 start_codon:yes stop_codon:yes gene_type:complete